MSYGYAQAYVPTFTFNMLKQMSPRLRSITEVRISNFLYITFSNGIFTIFPSHKISLPGTSIGHITSFVVYLELKWPIFTDSPLCLCDLTTVVVLTAIEKVLAHLHACVGQYDYSCSGICGTLSLHVLIRIRSTFTRTQISSIQIGIWPSVNEALVMFALVFFQLFVKRGARWGSGQQEQLRYKATYHTYLFRWWWVCPDKMKLEQLLFFLFFFFFIVSTKKCQIGMDLIPLYCISNFNQKPITSIYKIESPSS